MSSELKRKATHGIFWSCVESGIGSAIIRKPDINEPGKSTAFTFNMLVGVK